MSIFYIVAFWHMLDYTDAVPGFINNITIRTTYIILGIFIFISGYFIGLKKIELKKKKIIQFYLKKFLRIYPLYLCAICLFAILQISDYITLIKAAVAISMFLKPAPITLWFITMLISFYIVSPYIAYACQAMRIRTLMVFGSSVIVCLLAYSHFTKLLDVRIILYFPAFVAGIFVANNENQYILKKSQIIFLLVIICIFVSFQKINHRIPNILMSTPMVVLCSILLFRASKKIVFSSNWACKTVFLLSYSSYCMFLFHRPIYIVMKQIYFPETSLFQVAYLFFICLPCVMLLSFFIQKAYDRAVDMLTSVLPWTSRENPLL